MKEVLKIAGAFVGVIVGAGFASGRELLVFFVNYGSIGIFGTILCTILFTIIGLSMASFGFDLKSRSHQTIIEKLCGKYLGIVLDWMITFFMFVVAVVMFAGSGSLLKEQFGIPEVWGSIIVTSAIVVLVCLDVNKVMAFIGMMTPMMILMAISVAIYGIASQNVDYSTLNAVATEQQREVSYWWLASILYVSYNVVVGVPLLAIMGGNASSRRIALWGGILGGLILGGLMCFMGVGLLSRLNDIASQPFPVLTLAREMSSVYGWIVAVVIFMMIVNTGVGTLYGFSARLFTKSTLQFRIGTAITAAIGYICSLFGFMDLVGKVYPILGYLGFTLTVVILVAWFKRRKLSAG